MAKLYVNTPSNATYILTLDRLKYDSGTLGATNAATILPNGTVIASYAQPGGYISANAQRVVWGWHIASISFIGAFHLTTSGRPIPFTISGVDGDGCTLVSWDCASNGNPSESPIFAYVMVIGHNE